MTDAELLLEIVGCLADDPSQRRLIAAPMAVSMRPGSSVDAALVLLEEAGFSGFQAEHLTTMREHEAHRDFALIDKRLSGIAAEFEGGSFDVEQMDELLNALRHLGIVCGSIGTYGLSGDPVGWWARQRSNL
jgi:hypothetical protein